MAPAAGPHPPQPANGGASGGWASSRTAWRNGPTAAGLWKTRSAPCPRSARASASPRTPLRKQQWTPGSSRRRAARVCGPSSPGMRTSSNTSRTAGRLDELVKKAGLSRDGLSAVERPERVREEGRVIGEAGRQGARERLAQIERLVARCRQLHVGLPDVADQADERRDAYLAAVRSTAE